MDEKYSALFTPWKIGNVEIKNRIVMCPMGGTSLFGWMEPNHFDKESANLFRQIARNNVGLIIPGIAPLRDIIMGKWLYQGKGKFRKLKEFMDEIHKTGAKLFVQLTAGFGRSFAITDALVPFLKYKPLSVLMKPIIDIQHICASPSELPSRWAEGRLSARPVHPALHQQAHGRIRRQFRKQIPLPRAGGSGNQKGVRQGLSRVAEVFGGE